MNVKTSDLISPALDWAVTLIEMRRMIAEGIYVKAWVQADILAGAHRDPYSDDWLWGGPIIEREELCIWISSEPDKGKWAAAPRAWMDLDPKSDEFLNQPDPWHGPTPLVAAMRCYVESKMGDEIVVPDELCNGPT